MNRRLRGFSPQLLRVLLTASLLFNSAAAPAQSPGAPPQTAVTQLDADIRAFLAQQIAVHAAAIQTLEPAPERVLGAMTTGEFSWGAFARALGLYAELARTDTVGGKNIPALVGQMAAIERTHGGKTWAQLDCAEALLAYGADLDHNQLWQSLTPVQKSAYRSLLDPTRFYDPKTQRLINLPQNYLGVAARIAAISFELGIDTDRLALDSLLDAAARQFTQGALFADDAPTTGRFDRYSNEYARAVYDAAVIANRTDIQKSVAPSLKAQFQLWWDLLSSDGYGYPWGRSIGDISYMDTLEIAAFAAEYPEFRPAPLPELAAAYNRAWISLRLDFDNNTHLLKIFAKGRGEYSYIGEDREWQQTTTFFGKLADSEMTLTRALAAEKVVSFPSSLDLPDVNRYVSFRDGPGRQFGVWVVRNKNFHFALPFVTGPKAATSDYQPAPFGFSLFAVPVEKIYPCFTPFLGLADGRTIAAADGADEIKFAPDARSITATWRNWVVVGEKAGETIDPGLTTTVTWSLTARGIRRSETITASHAVNVQLLWMAIPTRADRIENSDQPPEEGKSRYVVATKDHAMRVQVTESDLPVKFSTYAAPDDPFGRGAQGAIPSHLILRSSNVNFEPGKPQSWEVVLTQTQ